MKQFIRNSTFETNSSSMHSLVVTKTARKYSAYNLRFDSFVDDEEFDLFRWDVPEMERTPFKVMRTPKDKLMYYIGWYIGFKGEHDKVDMIKEFLSKQLNLPIDKIKININAIRDDYMYPIVHPNDTGEDVFQCLEEHNVPFEEFILDPRYTVIIDGDEYREFAQMFDAKMIDVNNIDYISSGIDFWDPCYEKFNMYFVNGLAEEHSAITDIAEMAETNLTDPFITHLVLVDELDLEPDEDALKLFKEYILMADKQREKPLYKSLQIREDKARVKKYECVKDMFDEILVISSRKDF